jgi:hypothetical protein
MKHLYLNTGNKLYFLKPINLPAPVTIMAIHDLELQFLLRYWLRVQPENCNILYVTPINEY